MKVKTSELTGAQLDWVVSKCRGLRTTLLPDKAGRPRVHDLDLIDLCVDGTTELTFSTDWQLGGPIIEAEHLNLWSSASAHYPKESKSWSASKRHFGRHHRAGRSTAEGPTALIAAMRCYVTSKLGDEVEIPDELGDLT